MTDCYYDDPITLERTLISDNTQIYLVLSHMTDGLAQYRLQAASSADFARLQADPWTRAQQYWHVPNDTICAHTILFADNTLSSTPLTADKVKQYCGFQPTSETARPFGAPTHHHSPLSIEQILGPTIMGQMARAPRVGIRLRQNSLNDDGLNGIAVLSPK